MKHTPHKCGGTWAGKPGDKVFNELLSSPSLEASVVAARLASRDLRSSIAINLARIQQLIRLDPWTASKGQSQHGLEQALQAPIPEADRWRSRLLQKLFVDRLKAHYAAGSNEDIVVENRVQREENHVHRVENQVQREENCVHREKNRVQRVENRVQGEENRVHRVENRAH